MVCASWMSGVIKLVTHSFLLQTQVLRTQFVCPGRTCLCSWLLWWGGIAQQLTHLSPLHWGDTGEHSQVCRSSYLYACKWQNYLQYFVLLVFNIYGFISCILKTGFFFCRFHLQCIETVLASLRRPRFFIFDEVYFILDAKQLRTASHLQWQTSQEASATHVLSVCTCPARLLTPPKIYRFVILKF